MAIDMDPEILEIFKASNSVSGKRISIRDQVGLTLVILQYSFQGHFLTLNEGYSQEKTQQEADLRGQWAQRMGEGRDR